MYAGDSKLYLPVENIDLLTRYGTDGDGVQLDRLGGAAWQGRKAKAKLRPALAPANVAQTDAAGVTVIVAQDTRFYEHLPTQFPAFDVKPMFEANAAMVEATAARNSSLQGAYLILAARALGLDCGPQSGFNPQVVNEAFFPDGRYQVNFIVNLGVADPAGIYPRGPRLAFDDVAQII